MLSNLTTISIGRATVWYMEITGTAFILLKIMRTKESLKRKILRRWMLFWWTTWLEQCGVSNSTHWSGNTSHLSSTNTNDQWTRTAVVNYLYNEIIKKKKKDKGNSRVSIIASREILGEKTHFALYKRCSMFL